MLLREKLKELDIRLTDLAIFLKLSRPSIYKNIECYELGQRDKLESKMLKIFDFIMNEENASKTGAISYIFECFVNPNKQSIEERKSIITSWLKKDNPIKVDFIDRLIKSEVLDAILPYLCECEKILSSKKVLNETQKQKLMPLIELYKNFNLKLKENK